MKCLQRGKKHRKVKCFVQGPKAHEQLACFPVYCSMPRLLGVPGLLLDLSTVLFSLCEIRNHLLIETRRLEVNRKEFPTYLHSQGFFPLKMEKASSIWFHFLMAVSSPGFSSKTTDVSAEPTEWLTLTWAANQSRCWEFTCEMLLALAVPIIVHGFCKRE